MATKTTESGFKVVISDIEEKAYLMTYAGLLLPKLMKKIGVGKSGKYINYPYFDPTTYATGASTLTEANDFVNYTQLTNASVNVYASEFGIVTFLTDISTEDAHGISLEDEIARQQGIGVAYKLETHCVAAMRAGFTTGTTTGTNSSNGFTLAHFAVAKSKLAAASLTVPGRKHAVMSEYAWFYTQKSMYSTTYAAALPGPGEEALKNFYVGTVYGDVDVYTEPLAYMAASSTSVGAMFVTDSFGLWKPRDYRLEEQRDASARGDEIVSTMRGGAKVLIGGYGVRLNCYGSTPSI